MISHSRLGINQTDGIDFDKIVMDAAMREHLEYIIAKKKILMNKKGKLKKKDGAPAKPSKKRTEAPKATALKKAAKKKNNSNSSSVASLPRRVPLMRATE
jgi:hypothetical protein